MISNVPTVKDELICEMRKASEIRGLWYFMLVNEGVRRGLPVSFARPKIFELGISNKQRNANTDEFKVWADTFVTPNRQKFFEMEVVKMTDTEARVDFHYCPMLSAWSKLTDDPEFLSKICDMAMDVDRGLFSTYDHFEFELGDAIAAGGKTCQLCM